jgi:hypothetical protein
VVQSLLQVGGKLLDTAATPGIANINLKCLGLLGACLDFLLLNDLGRMSMVAASIS